MPSPTTASTKLIPVLVRTLGRVAWVLVVSAFIWGSGCPKPEGPKNALSGKVTLNGQPVGGELVLIGADGKETPTPLQLTGEYVINEPPTGSAKVVVRSMGGAPLKPPPGSTLPGAGGGAGGKVDPPKKFGDPKTTTITVEVKGGKQTFDIELEKF